MKQRRAKDELEALLATQMVGVHFLAMRHLQRASIADTMDRLELHANTATKMLRTFSTQMEALKRYRSKGESRVVVQHQHVQVRADQANVQVNGAAPGVEGAGSVIETGGQSHEQQQLAHAPLAPLWSENPERDAVPVPSDQG